MNHVYLDLLQNNDIDIYDDEGKKLKQALVDTRNFEHFADSIVEECIAICMEIFHKNHPNSEEYDLSEEVDAIKKYFGV